HVARIMLVSGCVGDDELALVRGEEAVSDVDGDLLLALGGKPVEQEGKIELSVPSTDPARTRRQRIELVLEQKLRLVQQPPDQRRLAVIDRAAHHEPQEGLAFLPSQERFERERARIGPHRHQKYPSCFLRSIDPAPSWSMTRPRRSENRLSISSRTISGTLVAGLSMAPVRG